MKLIIKIYLSVLLFVQLSNAIEVTYSGTTLSGLQSAITTISTQAATLIISSNVNDKDAGAYQITIPQNVELKFIPGASIKLFNLQGLTINGRITSHPQHIFILAWNKDNNYEHYNSSHNKPTQIKGTPLNKTIAPEWFGAKSNGTTNNINAFHAAITLIHGSGRSYILLLTPGTYTFNSTLEFDPSRVSIHGYGSTLKFIKNGVYTAIRCQLLTDNTLGHTYHVMNIQHNSFKDLNITSGSEQGVSLFEILCSRITFSNIRLSKAKKGIYFKTHSNLFKFDNCWFSEIDTCLQLMEGVDIGEHMAFSNCTFSGSKVVLYTDGFQSDYYFSNCAFDFNTSIIEAYNGSRVFINNSHIENSRQNAHGGSADSCQDYQFKVYGQNTFLNISNSYIGLLTAFDPPTRKSDSWIMPLAFCNAAGLGGISIVNCNISLEAMDHKDYNGPVVEGNGNVNLSNIYSKRHCFGFVSNSDNSYKFANSINCFQDGSFDSSNTNSIIDFKTINKKHISIHKEGYCYLYQGTPSVDVGLESAHHVAPGNKVLWGFRHQTKACPLYITQTIYNNNNKIISKTSASSLDTSWKWFNNIMTKGQFTGDPSQYIMPAGAALIEIRAFINSSSVSSAAKVDDFYLHVIK